MDVATAVIQPRTDADECWGQTCTIRPNYFSVFVWSPAESSAGIPKYLLISWANINLLPDIITSVKFD